ncbi:NADP-dependent oxidoreductase [Chitinophaga nivalis]|uniref:NADP-dependent oxidoreductase n=1 Tax=Chitinophaga nivalis TaxID=2991709 RepID=A0ABT3IRN5_9BACT|nr:NADP-dependent oxidoreductase [Chitinophaga nivalis]MCW3463895.1 NADP-dependent oxidoreductase [Chitinophaga nivalis]MCW3486415.1 NADP-dependent oxidoreductase [Chitinophaga nivalis]
MKAIILENAGNPDQLIHTDLPEPVISENEVLVAVKAISINPVDVKTRAGKGFYAKLKDNDPLILGWDISGVVTATGKAVTAFKPGDEVFGMVNFPGTGKAYAAYVAAPADHLARKPANISHEAAAAATLAALTAWQALVTNGNVQAGQKVLIHAAAGGVGHYAVQIARHLGAHVTGTASAANKDFVLSLGADAFIDYQTTPFETAISDVDFVLDGIGGAYIERSLEVLKPGGTLITIPSGLHEGITEKATAKGIKGYFVLVSSNGKDMQQLANLLEKGIIQSHISHTFPFADMAAAHEQVATGKTRGKVIVTL